MKRFSFWFLALILVFNLVWRASAYRPQYTTKFDPVYWQERYSKSQWVMVSPVEPIGDDGLFTYVGWELIHGADPSLINAETPPLGKYLIGLSSLVFQNQNLFALISGILALGAFYFLNKTIFRHSSLALLPVLLFSFEPLFWQQLRAPYLDLLYLGFLLLTFLFFLKKNYWLSTFFWACFLNTKAPLVSLLLPASAFLLFFILKKDKLGLKRWLLSLPLLVFVTLVVYVRYFQVGHSLRDFLGLQKWVFHFYQQGAKGNLAAIWSMLFAGRWYVWWQLGPVIVSEWRLTWPLVGLSFFFSFSRLKKLRHFPGLLLFFLWSLIYLLFLNFVPLWPRYLLIWLPFGYNLLVWNVYAWIKKKF